MYIFQNFFITFIYSKALVNVHININIHVDQNCANGGQCYLVMVPKKAKYRIILKIRVIVRLMLCSNGSYII